MIKNFIKQLIPSSFRQKLKKQKRHFINNVLKKNTPKTSLEDLKAALINDLGIKAGDTILVTSGFGSLNANYSPNDVIQLLQQIVTERGNIVMPYYPPVNSTEWAAKGEVFDMKTTKSGMGVLTNIFATSPNVLKSCHPTKAVCAWGKDAATIIEGHEYSDTPYYWNSPYGKILKLGSKSVGLGVKNIPIVHALEDILSDDKTTYYEKKKFILKVVMEDGEEKEVSTYVHDEKVLSECISPGDYVKALNCKTYKTLPFGYTFLYSVDNTDLFETMKQAFTKGHTRLKQ